MPHNPDSNNSNDEHVPALPPSQRFLALTGDVVGSRNLGDRAEFQRRLRQLIGGLNEELKNRSEGPAPLAAEFSVTAGDELQGLLSRPEISVDVLVTLADAVHPVWITWGIGFGRIETALDHNVSVLDGPCFHRARNAVDLAANEGAWARASGFDETTDQIISALFRLMGAIRKGWTETQARYVRAVRGQLQKEVAERYNVSPSVVSESLKAARYADLLDGESATRALMARFATADESESDTGRELNPAPEVPGSDLA